VHQQDDVLDDGVGIERAALRRILPEEGQQVCRGAGLGGPREIRYSGRNSASTPAVVKRERRPASTRRTAGTILDSAYSRRTLFRAKSSAATASVGTRTDTSRLRPVTQARRRRIRYAGPPSRAQ
jgi:hypothetical protein